MKFKQIVNLFYYACLGLLTLGLLASSVTEIHAFAAWASHAGNVFPHGPSSRDEVQVWVEVGCDDGNDGVQIADWVTNVSLYYRTGSQQPDGFNGTASAGSTAVALNWDHKEQNNGCPSGWASWWKGLIPPQKDGAQVRYVIESWHDQDPDPQHHHYADSVSFNQGVSTLMLGRGEATVFGYLIDDRYQKGNWSPEWARDAIFYQVFVDRFFDGSKNNNGSCPQRQPDGYCVKEIGSWNGGDLQGVIDKLGYLKDLGVNAIWLSPVFKTPEGPGDYHGYHVVDPQKVDLSFGSLGGLEKLVNAVHARGMRIVLDFVPNHVDRAHPFFKDANSKCGASSYYNYFLFKRCPGSSHADYATFLGVDELPKVNLQYQPVRDYVLAAAEKWLGADFNGDGVLVDSGPDGVRGVDGFRLDYARGPDPLHSMTQGSNPEEWFYTYQSFWRLFRAVVKTRNPNAYIFAENTFGDQYDAYNQYAMELDGTLDFPFSQAVYRFFTMGLGGSNVDDFHNAILAHELNYAGGFIPAVFIDNHDMERFFFSVGNNANVMKMAALAQFSVSGAPIVYYGDESGLSQDRPGQFDPARKRMQWGSGAPQGWNGPINQDVHNFYKLLTRARGAYRALRRGNYVSLYRNNETDTIAWGRYFPDANPASAQDDSVIVVMNLHPGRQTITLPNQSGFGTNLSLDLKLATGSTVVDKVSGQTFGVQNGKITLSLDSQGSAILVRQR